MITYLCQNHPHQVSQVYSYKIHIVLFLPCMLYSRYQQVYCNLLLLKPLWIYTVLSGCLLWSVYAKKERITLMGKNNNKKACSKQWRLKSKNNAVILTTQQAFPRSAILTLILSAFLGSSGFTSKSAARVFANTRKMQKS